MDSMPYSGQHLKRPASQAPRRDAGKWVVSAARLVTLTVMAQASDVVSPSAAGAARAGPKGRREAAAPAYPERVQAVLDHLEANPMRLQSIPMIYEADCSSAHLPAAVQGLTPEDVMPPPSQRRGADPQAAEHFARVVAGLLYVACGGLDQAHNLVTPLCWGAPTPYGGKPIPGSPAAQDASYVHALVHRAEGLHDGEFGTGFSNANYWYAATGPHPVHPRVLDSMRRHAAAAGDARLQQLAANHGDAFSPAKWVAVCAEAARGGGAGGAGGGGRDAALAGWCERVAADEFRALLEHCYSRLAAVA
ncbi:hypothetical protein PLESTB_000275100 [Pleodorina starrii]|uniref:Uncharacterized protein n=1 Tax=Pleodorina starrii TaxID=330485 RepID=A0A9W6EZ26_9CHLO|nr:hypothetical protein PLESTB_000275100 [Pleodorina starrii]GLC65506.1 hypothetical protein PLESTF_000304100 [Pleodorina starrii]